jgi:Ulp1 protease family, C-terminal catalytic domain
MSSARTTTAKNKKSVKAWAPGAPKPTSKRKRTAFDDLDIFCDVAPAKKKCSPLATININTPRVDRAKKLKAASITQLAAEQQRAMVVKRKCARAAHLAAHVDGGEERISAFDDEDVHKKHASFRLTSRPVLIDLTTDVVATSGPAPPPSEDDDGLVSGSDDDFVEPVPKNPSKERKSLAASKRTTYPIHHNRFAPPPRQEILVSRAKRMKARDGTQIAAQPNRGSKFDRFTSTTQPVQFSGNFKAIPTVDGAPFGRRDSRRLGAAGNGVSPNMLSRSTGMLAMSSCLRRVSPAPKPKMSPCSLRDDVLAKAERKPASSMVQHASNRRVSSATLKNEKERLDIQLPCETKDLRLRALTDAQLKAYRATTHQIAKAKVVAEIAEAHIVLRGVDIVRLRGRRWLNDEVINAFCALINSRNRKHFADKPAATLPSVEELLSIRCRAAEVAVTDTLMHNSEDECIIVEMAENLAAASQCFDEKKHTGSPVVRPGRPRAYIFNSFFFTRLSQNGYDYSGVRRWPTRAGVDIASLDLIMLPVNLSNYHWVLAAIDIKHREFLYFDSMYGAEPYMESKDTNSRCSTRVLQRLRRWLIDEITDKHGRNRMEAMDIGSWIFVDRPSYLPLQTDDGSCGVFTVYMADYLELGRTPDFVQDDIPVMRQHAVLFLVAGALPET